MANEPVMGATLIAAVKPTKDANGEWVPIGLYVDDIYSPPRLLIHVLGTINSGLSGVYTEVFAYNASNLVEYHGWAAPGLAKSAAVWAIVKFTYSSGLVTDIQWAGGKATFEHIWDNRASLSYS